MASSYAEVRVDTVGDVVGALTTSFTDKQVVWYRGQSQASWNLLPSLARKSALPDEKALRAQFRRDAVPLLGKTQIPGPLENDWDWMFLMQHYGVPTRLLDWSESPLTALWFAVNDETAGNDAALWALLPQKLNELRGLYPTQPWDIPLCGLDPATEDYTTNGLDDGSPSRVLTPLAVIAERRFARVIAQQGVFTVMHKDVTPLENLGDSSHISKIVIPEASRLSLRRELTRIGITEMSLFPDLGRLGALVARRLG